MLSPAVTYCHLLSLAVICCHSLSLASIRCTFHCHFRHSLLFVVTRCTTSCHLLLLVVTRCITSLSLYKRLIQSIKFATTYSLKVDVHKFQKCQREKQFWSSSYLVDLSGKNAGLHPSKLLNNSLLKSLTGTFQGYCLNFGNTFLKGALITCSF